jgi:L-lactate dehydrogenase complex protein LldG
VPDLLDLFAASTPGGLPANLTLISGPSKTADIEGILITGVHGPGAVHVILVR